ncbi:MAG: SDR family NAD(P)-dependent oxidoreductase [Rivihabitans pingtungensis]
MINISSINGQKGQFGQTNYSAAKAGMHGFSMALAQEVARRASSAIAGLYRHRYGDGGAGRCATKRSSPAFRSAGTKAGRNHQQPGDLSGFGSGRFSSLAPTLAINGGQHMM